MTAMFMITALMMIMAQPRPNPQRPPMMRWGPGSLLKPTFQKAPSLGLEEPLGRREKKASLLSLNLAC